MVVKTTKTPRKTTAKKATIKPSTSVEHKETIPVKEEVKTSIIKEDSKNTIEVLETKVEEIIKEIEKDVKQVENLSNTTIPYITRFIKKLKFW